MNEQTNECLSEQREVWFRTLILQGQGPQSEPPGPPNPEPRGRATAGGAGPGWEAGADEQEPGWAGAGVGGLPTGHWGGGSLQANAAFAGRISAGPRQDWHGPRAPPASPPAAAALHLAMPCITDAASPVPGPRLQGMGALGWGQPGSPAGRGACLGARRPTPHSLDASVRGTVSTSLLLASLVTAVSVRDHGRTG